jgi:pre-mRNA-processing factor 6
MDGKLQAARSIVSQGLKYCEESEDLWLEAARLEMPEVSKAILAKAVTILP